MIVVFASVTALLIRQFFAVAPIQADEDRQVISPFALGKWQVDGDRVQNGDHLVVSVNNNCLATMSEQNPAAAPMAMRFASQLGDPHQLKVQAYRMPVEDVASLNQLRDQAEDDVCVQGVANDLTLHATQYNDDPQFADQDYLRTINAVGAHELFWDSSVAIDLTADEEVVIAIVDTGVDGAHEDLSEILWDDGQGNFGFDFVNNDNDPTDDQGHGTHVAGLAAAKSSNKIGISGMMGFKARIMGVKVLDSAGAGGVADIANGIRYAADNGADIINMSLGGQGASAALGDAVAYAVNMGTTVFVAAGNDGVEITANNFYSPAGYAEGIEGAIAIGSIDAASKARSGFSNFSITYVELASPGSGPNGILSTYFNNGYEQLQGTSMATPIAAGAGGLVIGFLRSRGIAVTPAKVEEIMKAAAVKDGNLDTAFKDGNLLDMMRLARYLEASEVMQATGGLDAEF